MRCVLKEMGTDRAECNRKVASRRRITGVIRSLINARDLQLEFGEWSRIGVCGGVCKGECMGRSPGDEGITLTRCHSCGLLQLYEAFEGWRSVSGRAYNLNVIKGNFLFFFSFLSFASLLL